MLRNSNASASNTATKILSDRDIFMSIEVTNLLKKTVHRINGVILDNREKRIENTRYKNENK